MIPILYHGQDADVQIKDVQTDASKFDSTPTTVTRCTEEPILTDDQSKLQQQSGMSSWRKVVPIIAPADDIAKARELRSKFLSPDSTLNS